MDFGILTEVLWNVECLFRPTFQNYTIFTGKIINNAIGTNQNIKHPFLFSNDSQSQTEKKSQLDRPEILITPTGNLIVTPVSMRYLRHLISRLGLVLIAFSIDLAIFHLISITFIISFYFSEHLNYHPVLLKKSTLCQSKMGVLFHLKIIFYSFRGTNSYTSIGKN